MDDGLFFSYLLSRQIHDGVVYTASKMPPPLTGIRRRRGGVMEQRAGRQRRIGYLLERRLRLSASFFADADDSFVNQIFQFVCHWHVGEGFVDRNDGLIERTPFDGILRKCAFLEALGRCFR
jgi:hypothetical protein